jgi:hypothetical protein
MKHYICTGGCAGVSDKPGTCQAVDCPKHGLPLEECDCADSKHYGRQENEKVKENSSEEKDVA